MANVTIYDTIKKDNKLKVTDMTLQHNGYMGQWHAPARGTISGRCSRNYRYKMCVPPQMQPIVSDVGYYVNGGEC